MSKTINIARDFSPYPAGRYRTDGPWSGEEFREDYLVPALESGQKVIVVIDDVKGMPVSFMEEAFGGLVRSGRFTSNQLQKVMDLNANTPQRERYVGMIWNFIRTADAH